MIGFYNYTVILTYIGLVSTFVGFANVINGRFSLAIFCLIISGLCDMFDGVIARSHKNRTDDEKKFGIQIDSLCDLVCFGVFPAVFNYAYTLHHSPDLSIIAIVISTFLALTAVIRLGYFNVMEEKRQQSTSEPRNHYQGVPVTMVAVFLPLVYIFKKRFDAIGFDFSIILNAYCLIAGLLQILNIKVPKAHKRGITFLSILGAVIIIITILQYFEIIGF